MGRGRSGAGRNGFCCDGKGREAENVRYFGAAYRAYMQRTKMFIPFFFCL